MQIHIKSGSERLSDIAEKYGVTEENIRLINEIPEGECAEGEELLILTPTRSYTVQQGDTPERIALRFGLKRRDIYPLNPWLSGEIAVGQTLALGYSRSPRGMAVANGYFYKGCREQMLRRAMPYLTYVTFAAGVADERGVRRSADYSDEVRLVSDERKIPLIRVYDRYTERYRSEGDYSHFAEELINLARSGRYKGIVLDACRLNDSAEEFAAFLMILRRMMIGCDLILITEINEESPLEFSEYADGSVMYYPKYAMDEPADFDRGERAVLSDFALRGESARAFIDLPSIARYGRDYVTVSEALRYARRWGLPIHHNESTLLSHIKDRRQGEYRFSSLRNIKALLELTGELDYTGICFDIMRTPLSHLMMYSAMFKTSYLTPDSL